MLNREQVIELVSDMVQARIVGDQEALVQQIHGVINGELGDVLNVAMAFAELLAADLGDNPPGGFHRPEVFRFDPDGSVTPTDVTDLPPLVAVFAQMVTAVANKDKDMARNLFLGYVDYNWERAMDFLIFALNEVLHANELCGCCNTPPEV